MQNSDCNIYGYCFTFLSRWRRCSKKLLKNEFFGEVPKQFMYYMNFLVIFLPTTTSLSRSHLLEPIDSMLLNMLFNIWKIISLQPSAASIPLLPCTFGIKFFPKPSLLWTWSEDPTLIQTYLLMNNSMVNFISTKPPSPPPGTPIVVHELPKIHGTCPPLPTVLMVGMSVPPYSITVATTSTQKKISPNVSPTHYYGS